MELGLSLGESKPFDFLGEKKKVKKILQEKQRKNRMKKKGSLDFCMSLGLNNSNGNQEQDTKTQLMISQEKLESGDDDDDDDDENQRELDTPDLQLNLLPAVSRQSVIPWSSDNGSSENGSSGNIGLPAAARGFDVNRAPAAATEEVSSANSMGSPFRTYRNNTGMGCNNNKKRDFETIGNDVVEAERTSSRASDDIDDEINGLNNARKKLRLSKDQSAFLEDSFKEHHTLNPKQKLALAKQLNLRPRQVEVWFQNRRARTKLKQTEVDCEYLKRCCETLTDENRRLHKELQELRVLKTSNPYYMQLPATTLTMCPSCERVATTSTALTATTTTTTTTTTVTATKTNVVNSPPKAIPFPLTRPKFYPFSQTLTRPNQHAAS